MLSPIKSLYVLFAALMSNLRCQEDYRTTGVSFYSFDEVTKFATDLSNKRINVTVLSVPHSVDLYK